MGAMSNRWQPLFDRARQALYAAAFVVAIGSLWTIAWANSLDDHQKPNAGVSDRSACLFANDDLPVSDGDATNH
jgi:hypothetical protein